MTIGLASSDASEGTASTPSLTFTEANWNVPQTVVVTGSNRNTNNGPIGYSISFGTATSADPKYRGIVPSSVALTNIDAQPTTNLVSIQLVTVKVKKSNITEIVLTFSDSLNVATVGNLANYRLVAPGRDKKFNTKDDVVNPITSAVYVAVSHSVMLKTKNSISHSPSLRFTLISAGLLDHLNNPVNGTRGNVVAIIGKAGVSILPAFKKASATQAVGYPLPNVARRLSVDKKV